MFFWLLLTSLSLALADAADDLLTAANPTLQEKDRMAAFQRLVQLGNTDLQLILKVSQDGKANLRKRWVAIRVLGQVGGEPAKRHLPPLLEDRMPAVRAAAASALGDIASWKNSAQVARRLQDNAVVVRAAAAEALGKIGDPSVVPALEQAIFSRRNYYRGSSLWVRRHYVQALGAIRHKKAYPVLLRSMDDKDPQVAKASIEALEVIAGFRFSDGRDAKEEKEAWRRWLNNRIR